MISFVFSAWVMLLWWVFRTKLVRLSPADTTSKTQPVKTHRRCSACLDADVCYRAGENSWLPVVLEFAGENLGYSYGVRNGVK